jgi:hypothetical protein
MRKELEFLRESIVVLSKKVEILERWCAKHEAEGLEYGNDFEERDTKLNEHLADISSGISSLAQDLNHIDERLVVIEDHLVI